MGKKSLMVLVSILLVIGIVAGCGGSNSNNGGAQPSGEPGQWKDGTYYAEGEFDEKSGWKDVVAFKVENGKITEVNWNALNKNGGLDKKTYSKQGKYGMAAKGAQSEWHEQAAKAEQFLIEKQDPKAIVINEDGKTDAISGVSISVDGFVKLVTNALNTGPVKPGPYKDGTYYAEEPDFAENGWKYHVTVTVMNGNIVAVDWNGTHKDGGDDKDTQSANGTYGMVAKGGAQAEWHEQAARAEQFLIEKQDPKAIKYTDDQGHTDAISGVSIHVKEFFTLAEEALKNAK